ncbi:MAG TPA: PLP-dependent aminotransferase family protein [Galbitalea sp.]|jgi:DNA-binding transcriptional MocR family regulator|nr:PLP-dependent aminotransferase family protein [Galbitalea sp.]
MISLSARQLAQLLGDWRATDSGAAYFALSERIRLLILDGRIALGTRLPAERELATVLDVSRTTVTAAYTTLRGAGFLSSTRGSGSVARLPHSAPRAPEETLPDVLDLSKAALPSYPGLAGAMTRAAELAPAYLGSNGFDTVGLPVLREALADRYSARGLPTSADEILVTIGAQHAIALIARVLVTRGDTVLIESPSYPHAIEALRGAGARLRGAGVSTEGGWDANGMEQVLRRSSPTLGYLMPDFHNPTGQSMPDELREHIVHLAASVGTVLVADETIAELAIDGPIHTLPFAAHGHPGSRPVLVGSVGKTLWGGLRIGWIRAERSIIQRLVRARTSGDLGTPILEQLIVADLLRDYDAVLESRRVQLRDGRDQLLALLAARLPEWRVTRPDGGLTVWVNLGAPVSSQLTLAARNEGLLLGAGPLFGIDGAFERFLRIPFSHPTDELDRAVDALARAWRIARRFAIPEHSELGALV